MMVFPLNWTEAQTSIFNLMVCDIFHRSGEFSSKIDPTTEEVDVALETRLLNNENPSQFHEINNFLIEAVSRGPLPVAMIDMPEILLRL